LIYHNLTIYPVTDGLKLGINDHQTVHIVVGGTFALYSLICRYAKVSLTPNQQAEDKEVSNYRLDVPNRRLKRASFVKSMLEKNQKIKYSILFITMLGTSMVLGDGILTPCISGTADVMIDYTCFQFIYILIIMPLYYVMMK
jgi:hypothetical protein